MGTIECQPIWNYSDGSSEVSRRESSPHLEYVQNKTKIRKSHKTTILQTVWEPKKVTSDTKNKGCHDSLQAAADRSEQTLDSNRRINRHKPLMKGDHGHRGCWECRVKESVLVPRILRAS
jgi:hypothetical protein